MSTTIPERRPSFPPGLFVCPFIVDLVPLQTTFSLVHLKNRWSFLSHLGCSNAPTISCTGRRAWSSLFAQISTSYSLIPLYSDASAVDSSAIVPSFPAPRPIKQNKSGHLGRPFSLQYVQSCSPITNCCHGKTSSYGKYRASPR